MSGPKVSEYDLEMARKARLAAALEKRKQAYLGAISRRNLFTDEVNKNIAILQARLDFYESKSGKSDNICAAYGELANEVRDFINAANIMLLPVMRFTAVESESEDCPEANWIDKETQEYKSQLKSMIAGFSRFEEEKLAYISEANDFLKFIEELKRIVAARINEFNKYVELKKSTEELSTSLKRITDSLSYFEKESNALFVTPIPPTREKIKTEISKIKNKTNELIENLNKSFATEAKKFADFEKSKSMLDEMNKTILSEVVSWDDKSPTAKIKNVLFEDCSEPDYYETLEKEAREEYDTLLNELEDAIISDSVFDDDKFKLHSCYKGLTEGKNDGLIAKISYAKSVLKDALEKAGIFNERYCEYITVVEMTNAISREISEKEIVVKERSYFNSISEIEAETEHIQRLLNTRNEQKYILDTMRSIMREFGYSMEKELFFSENGKGFDRIYHCDNKNTAIHVCYNDSTATDKKIMLEIVGIRAGKTGSNGKVNVTVTGHQGLSEQRKDELFREEGVFCEMHPKITEQMGKMGINVSPLIHNKPSKESCIELEIDFDKENATEHANEKAKSNNARRAKLKEMTLEIKPHLKTRNLT